MKVGVAPHAKNLLNCPSYHYHMKNLLLFSIVAIIFSSCSKDSPSVPDPQSAPKISSIPSSFVQKIVIENFTMTSCGQCPKYNLLLDSLMRFNPDRIYGLTIHVGDVMEDTNLLTVTGRNYYDSLFNPTQIYPSGMVNRRLASLADLIPDNWPAATFSAMGYVPSCGVAIEAEDINNSNLHMIVHVGFVNALPGQYNLHILLVKDQVVSGDSLYDQMNDYSSEGATPDSTLPLYQLNDTIHLYSHHYVLQKVLSDYGPDGDPIPMTQTFAGNHYTAGYNIDLSSVDVNNSFILVYVDKYATTMTGHRIENAQVVRIGNTKDWN
jgi:hypothetical protein